MTGFISNVNITAVLACSTGQSSYVRRATLRGVPVYGHGRWILRQLRSASISCDPAWGLRLGEEALLAVLAHGFNTLDLSVIVAGHGVAHENSRKLLERVGFRYTHNILWGPKEIEVCMWAITAHGWQGKNPSS